MTTTEHTELERELTRIIESDPVLRALFARRLPRWRYFNVGRTMDVPARRGFPAFAWSTEPVQGKYQSWMWKPIKEGWEVIRLATHSTRKAAKARALRMRNSYAAKRERGNK